MEALLHPRVRQEWSDQIDADPQAEWLVEIPLLFEKRLETHFDLTVCVSSSYEIILRRMEGRGYSKSETEQRMCRQMPLADKMSRADHVIFNAGSIEFLKQQTTCLIQQLRQSPTKSD